MLVAFAVFATGASGKSHHAHHPQGLSDSVFATGTGIFHTTSTGAREAVSLPDDITALGGDIYVGFQNGVGPQGQASTTGNLNSTVVEFDSSGNEVGQWDIAGKCDGLTADPETGEVIATVNEDANSSLYLITPGGSAVHYHYSQPLPSNGGTDAISIYHGEVLISASAPGTTGTAAPQPTYPAVYRARFDAASQAVTLRGLFSDEALARVANRPAGRGHKFVHLALTDPDSNEVVPDYAPRFGGDFMLTSQGDQQQIFYSGSDRRRGGAVGAQPQPLGRRHGVAVVAGRRALHDRQRREHDLQDHRRIHPRFDARCGDAVRPERCAEHVPRTGIPAELPWRSGPEHRQHHRRAGRWSVVPASGHAVPGALIGDAAVLDAADLVDLDGDDVAVAEQ